VAALVAAARLTASSSYAGLRQSDVVFVCVPTPFDANKTPDLRAVHQAADGIAAHLHPGHLVVLQSTTYPGTTEEAIRPRLEAGGLRAGQDFYLAFSPERIDPGVPAHTVLNTPKVVGGVTPACTAHAAAVLGALGTSVHPVSSPRVAEMTKLLENIFRSVNIALVNELALLCERMGIDVWEVIGAAATKPFGFMPFRPSAGVGGHCIPIDPYYLAWKAREFDFSTRFIELAADINQGMPSHIVQRVARWLDGHGRTLRDARVLILGVAFKPNVDDPRHSPAERVIELLLERGARVRYHDPYVPAFSVGGDVFHQARETLHSVALTDEELAGADIVVVVTAHHAVDYARVARLAKLVLDTANAVPADAGRHVARLGAPEPQGAHTEVPVADD
jgi:UDP-N-acetyl-D-glucosamine dehydrogenase